MTVLLVLLTAILFIVTHRVLLRQPTPFTLGDQGPIPEGFGLAVNHLWVRDRNGERIRIGLDTLLSRITGVPELVMLPARRTVLNHTESPIALRYGNGTLSLSSPVAGTVVEVNRRVIDNPSLIHDDPYGQGWLLEIRRDAARDHSRSFLVRHPVRWLAEQTDKAVGFFMTEGGMTAPVTSPDGGVLVDGLLWRYDDTVCDSFQKHFATLHED